MPVSPALVDALQVARAFADDYARGSAPQVASLLSADVHEREITPGGVIDQRGRDAVIAEAVEFLRPYGRPEVLLNTVEPLGDVFRWSTRWRLRSGEQSWLVEWHAFLTVQNGVITKMDVVCSGRVRDQQT